ncbi:enoyl-CoA hydratase/isomerase family protein [Psychrobacillus antarcticus]|uniref:enoyl-CoA hydratase/isomerase family protein n=1 Tax=Psychrobacillus antarcticus TaxID=2879115 RepID=UPI0024081544|nr:enoyl-CoA hydratase-related protein [Psychrobacillus antarcticus]
MSYVLTELLGDQKNIFQITLNRPAMRNSFNTEMAEQLLTIFQNITNDKQIQVVILNSSDPKSFCSGADLKERQGMSDEKWGNQHYLFERMVYALEDLPQATIALVNGFALAGGFELALNCDLIIASENAKFGLPEVTRGIMPGCGGARLLPQRVASHIAKEWLFTGRIVDAQEAYQSGLLNKLVKDDELQSVGLDLAIKIASNASLGIMGAKQVVNKSISMKTDEARQFEIETYKKVVHSEDRLEGVIAFNEKRKPVFKGR